MRSFWLPLCVILVAGCGRGDDDAHHLPDMTADVCASLPLCNSGAGCPAGQHCVDIAAGGRHCIAASDHCGLGEQCGFADSCADHRTLRITYGNRHGACAPEYIACRFGCVEADLSAGDGGVASHCR